MPSVEVETPRLLLVPWAREYLDDLARIASDSEVMRYISGGRPLSRADAEQVSSRSQLLWEAHGIGPWAAIHKQTGRWVGRIGLNLLEDWPGRHRWEVGWELDRSFWGQGLATEGGREGVRVGFDVGELERIISVTARDNSASRRVMEKCGLTYRGTADYRGTEAVWYGIDRPEESSAASRKPSHQTPRSAGG